MVMEIVKHRKIYFIFSGLLILASLVVLFGYGLKPGIDFTGGTIMELEYLDERPTNEEISSSLEEFNLGTIHIQPTGEKGIIVRMTHIEEDVHQSILDKLRGASDLDAGEGLIMKTVTTSIDEIRFESVGPVIGNELKQKTSIVVIAVLLSMII